VYCVEKQFYNNALILILNLFRGDRDKNHLELTDIDLIYKSIFDKRFTILI